MELHTALTDQTRDLLLRTLIATTGGPEIPLPPFSEAEWGLVVREAARHGVAPLIFHHLERTGKDGGPSPADRETLRQAYLVSARSNLRLYTELNRILRALRQAGIPTIVLKGAHLAQLTYHNIALRPMNDLDLLIRLPDCTRAEQLLLKLGYQTDDEEHDRGWYESHHFHYRYRSLSGKVHLELHWDLQRSGSPFSLDLKEIWQRATPVVLAGVETNILAPEDLILYLCVHVAFTHLFDYYAVRSLYDLVLVLQREARRIDWAALRETACRWGVLNCTYLSLRLADDLLRAMLPTGVLSRLEPEDFDPRLLGWALERIFADPDLEGKNWDSMPRMSNRFGQVYASRSVPDRLTAFWKTLFPPPRLLGELYGVTPSSASFYRYYLIRVKDLALRYALKGWLLLIGDRQTLTWMEQEGKRAALLTWMTRANPS